ncbi:hypothetical protein [Aquimarina sp. AU119]|uniref:hypothetical protein n=1 Tax=Aquimarina sp. AU119 TaxID=2108528 RepID=UPI000D688B90|nr:hypothetical protein [Aquimarina sp. AU119]
MILVFKTTVTSTEKANSISPFIDALPAIIRWNFDLEDCDNVLRIECTNDISQEVIDLLKRNGIECVDLDSELLFDMD